MSNSETWTTTISTLLLTFRKALMAIIPFMDIVKIGWKDNEAYDDWDDIASTLYKNVVEKSIQHADQTSADTKLPPYDLPIPSYEDYSYISVKRKISEGQNLVFVGFSTRRQPFDSVKCVSVDSNHIANSEILFLSVNECEFGLVLRNKTGEQHSITDINVEI